MSEKINTSLAQLKIGLKLVFDNMGAWRMLMVPDWRFGDGAGYLVVPKFKINTEIRDKYQNLGSIPKFVIFQ